MMAALITAWVSIASYRPAGRAVGQEGSLPPRREEVPEFLRDVIGNSVFSCCVPENPGIKFSLRALDYNKASLRPCRA
jgi:hypothetical protein